MHKDILPLESSHPIFDALVEIQKPRSRYQLERFVLGQHDTDEQRYRQTLLEIQQLIYTLKVVSLELKKQQIEIDTLKKSESAMERIDAEIKEIQMEQTHLTMLGAQRELSDLVAIWESFEHKYTYEELEKLQPEYWKARLSRQAQLEALGSNGQIGWASLDALRQIDLLEVPELSPIEKNKEIK